ncbi:unnamed protein product, partial [Effrenium voratum]
SLWIVYWALGLARNMPQVLALAVPSHAHLPRHRVIIEGVEPGNQADGQSVSQPRRCVGVETPPVAPSPSRCSGLPEDVPLDSVRNLSTLCTEAAAQEVAALLVGPMNSSGSDETHQRAHNVAKLLLSSSERHTATSPPYLRRLFMLRRSRRRVRAVRQVKLVLGLRGELLLRAAWTSWASRAQLRRHVLLRRALAEVHNVSKFFNLDWPWSRCLAKQVLLAWSWMWMRSWRRRCLRPARRIDGLSTLVGCGEAAFRLVLLYASLHAWSECCTYKRDQRNHSEACENLQADAIRYFELRVFATWSRLVFKRQAGRASNRLAQESAALLSLQLRFGFERHRHAERWHMQRLTTASFKMWLQVIFEQKKPCKGSNVHSLPRASSIRILHPCWTAWRLRLQAAHRDWHFACCWCSKMQKVSAVALLRAAMTYWRQSTQGAHRVRALEVENGEHPKLRLGRKLLAAHLEPDRSLAESDTVFQSVWEADCSDSQAKRHHDDRTLTLSFSSSSSFGGSCR